MHRFMRRFRPRFGARLTPRFGPEMKQLALTQMRDGQSGVVVEILGGRRMTDRLSALGVRPGLKVTKVGAMFLRGPVTIQTGNARIAIGFGMANRVIVEPVQV